MTLHYIFTTYAEAESYERDVTTLRNYKDPTNRWSVIRKKQGEELYAVVASDLLTIEGKTPQSIDNDWTVYEE